MVLGRSEMGTASALIMDTYDVLLVNLLSNAAERFYYLEEHVQIPGFADARMCAEKYLLEHVAGGTYQFVSLDAVYGKMHHIYQHIQEKEVKLTALMTRVNPEARELLRETVEHKIPVYLLDASGFPRSMVEQLLEEHGCTGYEKLYTPASEDELEGICHELMQTHGIAAHEILYVTGRKTACRSGSTGISVQYCESLNRRYGRNLNSSFFSVLSRYEKKDAFIPLLKSSIELAKAAGKLDEDWFAFGYKYIGILAFEFAKYMGDIAEKLHVEKLIFSAENGECLQYAVKLLSPKLQTEIVPCPEHVMLLSGLYDERDAVDGLLRHVKAGMTFQAWLDWIFPLGDSVLVEAYREAFPEQERVISLEEDFERLRSFFAEHVQLILAEAEKARTDLQAYLQHVEKLGGSAAFVDVGKHLHLLTGLQKFFRKQPQKPELLAFWWEYVPGVSWKSGLLENARVRTEKQRNKTEPNDYLHRILTLALSGAGTEIGGRIAQGAIECIQDLYELDRHLALPIRQDGAMAVCEYLQEQIDRRDQMQLEQAYTAGDSLEHGYLRPMFRQNKPVIGIANPWPEDVSAEAEVITRIKRTAEENQIKCVLLDGVGHILNDKQGQTKDFVKDEDISFVITTHYECAKLRNIFYYNPLWNPPEIPLNLSDYATRVTNQFMMNDDFLIYDDGGMSNHLRSILMNCPRTLEGASALTASFPASAALPPKLDNPIMFYCGMNWEVMFGKGGRHEGLFKLLDDSRKVEIYGPERVDAWGGLKPWEGYHCYKGMIPFDGFSILKKINECGICLVLSSDTHRRAGAATNRLYEACAAGAVIISDDNEFVLEHFRDAALFITFNKNDPIDTFRQIMEKYEWIIKHPKEALALARRAQEIYLQEYSLDVQLNQIIHNHPARFRQLSRDLYARDDAGKVLVTFVLDTQEPEMAKAWLDNVIRNVHGQLYRNIELAVAADTMLAEEIAAYCDTCCACAHVIEMPLFDAKGVRALTDGEAIRSLQKAVPHTYFMNTTAREAWFFDHVTALVRAVTEGDCLGAYSGSAFEDALGIRRVNFFDRLNADYLYNMERPDHLLVAGQFLFKAEAHALLPDYLFGNLDGREHMAYAGFIRYRHSGEVAFTKRMSLVSAGQPEDARCAVLSDVMQTRFIQDLLRFYIPEQAAAVTGQPQTNVVGMDDKRTLTDLLLYVPIKTYFRLRYYRFQMRRQKPGSERFKKYSAKYDACLEQYRQYWNV